MNIYLYLLLLLVLGNCNLVLAHLFVKIHPPGDSEVTFSIFESSYHLLLYQSNRSKVEKIPLSVLPKDTTSEQSAYLHTYYPFNVNVKQESCE